MKLILLFTALLVAGCHDSKLKVLTCDSGFTVQSYRIYIKEGFIRWRTVENNPKFRKLLVGETCTINFATKEQEL